MRSEKPKVLQTLGGEPLLYHILKTVHDLNPTKIHIVVGQHAPEIKQWMNNKGKLIGSCRRNRKELVMPWLKLFLT